MQIKRWYDGAVLYEDAHETMRETVEAAVASGASLDGASLYGAILDGASLDGASLYGASLDGARLDGAILDNASLVGASLDGARLDRASLVGARLDGARLVGASLDDASVLPEGCTWQEFTTVVLPALLTAGGEDLASFAEHWDCHTWDNCPMHHAFGASGLSEVPAPWRPWANRFVQLYDAGLLPVAVLGREG